jgi:hypothetical protein
MIDKVDHRILERDEQSRLEIFGKYMADLTFEGVLKG